MRFKDSSLLGRCIVSIGSYPIFEVSQYLYLPGRTALVVLPFYDCLNLKNKAWGSVGKSATIYQSTRRNMPDDLNLSNIAVRISYLAMYESRLFCIAGKTMPNKISQRPVQFLGFTVARTETSSPIYLQLDLTYCPALPLTFLQCIVGNTVVTWKQQRHADKSIYTTTVM